MLGRPEIQSALRAALPATVDVIGYARNIDPPLKPTVMVRIDKVRPSKIASAMWDVEAALVLIAAQTIPGPADDELDNLLHDVLLALDKLDQLETLTWREATRAVYGEPDPTNPAYEVAVNTQTQKEQ